MSTCEPYFSDSGLIILDHLRGHNSVEGIGSGGDTRCRDKCQVIRRRHTRKGKPDPEPYVKGSTLLGLSPMECVVVEDVPAGIRSGKGAGARVIAFTTTVAPGELAAVGATWILPNCSAMHVKATHDGLILSLDLVSE